MWSLYGHILAVLRGRDRSFRRDDFNLLTGAEQEQRSPATKSTPNPDLPSPQNIGRLQLQPPKQSQTIDRNSKHPNDRPPQKPPR
jgi:hypothetical protein